MNIAIDEFKIHLDVKHTGRVLTALNDTPVGLTKRLLDGQTVNGTSVENHELEEMISPTFSGTGNKSPKAQPFSRELINFQELSQVSPAKQIPNTNCQIFGSRKGGNCAAVTPALESHRGVR